MYSVTYPISGTEKRATFLPLSEDHLATIMSDYYDVSIAKRRPIEICLSRAWPATASVSVSFVAERASKRAGSRKGPGWLGDTTGALIGYWWAGVRPGGGCWPATGKASELMLPLYALNHNIVHLCSESGVQQAAGTEATCCEGMRSVGS